MTHHRDNRAQRILAKLNRRHGHLYDALSAAGIALGAAACSSSSSSDSKGSAANTGGASASGGKKRLALSPDNWLDVTIPPGIEQGQVLRLKGKGGAESVRKWHAVP